MIGCWGTRAFLLADALHRLNLDHKILYKEEEVTSEFDFVLVSGCYQKIKSETLIKPRLGIFCFHESDLPFGAGSAPLPWTLILGLDQFTVSMFKASEQFDTGTIIKKLSKPIERWTDVHVLEEYRKSLITELIFSTARELLNTDVNGLKGLAQFPLGKRCYFPRRYPSDGIVSEGLAQMPLWYVWRTHIRACHNQSYPCIYKDKRLYYYSCPPTGKLTTLATKFADLKLPCVFLIGERYICLEEQL